MEFFSLNDCDEEIVDFMKKRRMKRASPKFRTRVDHFSVWNDNEFQQRFRLPKNVVGEIHGVIGGKISSTCNRSHAISSMDKLLLTLRFFATGSVLLAVGDFSGIGKSSASTIIHKVSYELALLSREIIKMPEENEDIYNQWVQFYKRAKMPRVIGTIDCTHIRIQNPGGENAENFRCRKGYFSINVQTVSSYNSKILDIVARWPGSTHDQTIYNNSNLKTAMESGVFQGSFLVGDSGYENNAHLITPLSVITSKAQELYNESVVRTRNVVERQYGILKRRFPVLASILRLDLNTARMVIIACAVLHNICIDSSIHLISREKLEEDRRRYIDFARATNVAITTTTAREQLVEYFGTL